MPQEALNHRFFEMMLRENLELGEVIRGMREQLDGVEPEAKSVQESVERLADLARSHFAHEEQGGYMTEAIEAEPRLAERVAALRSQHTALRSELEKLVALAGQFADDVTPFESLRSSLREFLSQLLDHEAAENDLVQEAFILDIGSKD